MYCFPAITAHLPGRTAAASPSGSDSVRCSHRACRGEPRLLLQAVPIRRYAITAHSPGRTAAASPSGSDSVRCSHRACRGEPRLLLQAVSIRHDAVTARLPGRTAAASPSGSDSALCDHSALAETNRGCFSKRFRFGTMQSQRTCRGEPRLPRRACSCSQCGRNLETGGLRCAAAQKDPLSG